MMFNGLLLLAAAVLSAAREGMGVVGPLESSVVSLLVVVELDIAVSEGKAGFWSVEAGPRALR